MIPAHDIIFQIMLFCNGEGRKNRLALGLSLIANKYNSMSAYFSQKQSRENNQNSIGKLCVSQYGTHDCEYISACINTVCAYVSACVSGKMRIHECICLAKRFEGAPMGLQRVAAVVYQTNDQATTRTNEFGKKKMRNLNKTNPIQSKLENKPNNQKTHS